MTNKYFQSTKRFTGYSVAFRQYKATHSHCQYLHGYDLEFVATFKGLLDDKNWIIDFGLFKNNGIKSQLDYLFDHTTIVDKNDPHIDTFRLLQSSDIIQLRIIDDVSCEKFAQLVFLIISKTINNDRVKCIKVQCLENNNNSASFSMDYSQ